MKKLYVFFLLCISFQIASAQNEVPNGSFEQWTNMGDYENPNGWVASNFCVEFLGTNSCFVSVEKSSEAFAGTYAAKIKTLNNPDGTPESGFLISGQSDGVDYTPVPFTGRPEKLTGNYKFNKAGNDTASIAFALFTDATLQTIVGSGELVIGVASANYTSFEIPVEYELTSNPQFMAIAITSSDEAEGTVTNGTYIIVDNLQFVYSTTPPTAVYVALEENTKIYPSPASQFIKIETSATVEEVKLINSLGRTVLITTGVTEINVQNLPDGIYFAEVVTSEGTVRKKFAKK